MNNISNTVWNDFESLGADTLDTSGRASKSPNILTTAEIRCKEELLTNLSEDDDDDYIDNEYIDSYEPFRSKPNDDIDKLSKVKYGDTLRLNEQLK